MSDEITVVAILKTKAGCEDAVAKAMAACAPASRAEATNRQYVPNRDLDDPQTLIFIERWASRQALADHMETPHFKQLAAALEGKLEAPLQVHILQPVA
ncbi:MAG: antibiotic biosynthesis monooxygenase [Acetobacter fabarum]|jgi:quinol monooxygenase YgiN|uniref:putative quinol monooxygenase n=1 Tax=Acetobacter fabarum TaxID=483199 RepID=UPI00242BC1A3|nr:putative quinol monooxygenase [Acetobacter fabarum]MCH4024905.1 antibiotic biosynthesis monooxygenase [Acetobacter fabarum]MCH4055699.1 antibiotic biosynthesis monooxygenase [Acetobacter fabarum]MCH4128425.1 antibiotic biosynthesis monooxygenase [Acetobacter fabarum]MCH4141638.1 antibiotic biosynthesis monooxygenase [Acetobacter fabarum]MCI1298007.1 antibiotic biosynthesis monooxygenase [Acetobacter fabarum]